MNAAPLMNHVAAVVRRRTLWLTGESASLRRRLLTCGPRCARLVRLWVLSLIFVLAGCVSPGANQPPRHAAVEEAHFNCPKCDSLSGGVIGRSAQQNFRSRTAERCAHRWERVTEQEFKRLAPDRYGFR